MDRYKIVNEVKNIILKYAKPERIYLYGSMVNGEAKQGSDIDIAYIDEDFKQNYLIEEEVDALDTLIKIDVKNIAKSDKRFKNRVISTGRVLYSATKKLRAEDGLYNFSKAFDKFENALNQKEILEREGFGDIFLDLIVKRFEFTYEMAWKALKRYLDFEGIEAKTPRQVFKEGFSSGFIRDEDIWLDMIEQRNLSSHIYDEDEIKGMILKAEEYLKSFKELKNNIKRGLDGDITGD